MDPISDMLNRIKNAQRAKMREVVVPFSKLKMVIAGILEKEGFIELFKKETDGRFDVIRIILKYENVSNTEKTPAISEIKRISKTGRRIYIKKSDVYPVKNNFGFSIISTSKGIMTNKEAKKAGLGGEIICEVW